MLAISFSWEKILSAELSMLPEESCFNSPHPFAPSLLLWTYSLWGCWLQLWMLRKWIQLPPRLAENALYLLTHLPWQSGSSGSLNLQCTPFQWEGSTRGSSTAPKGGSVIWEIAFRMVSGGQGTGKEEAQESNRMNGHYLAVWHWTNNPGSLSLSFLIHNGLSFTGLLGGLNEIITTELITMPGTLGVPFDVRNP